MLAPAQVKNNIPHTLAQQLPAKANIHAREVPGIEQLPGTNERTGVNAAFGTTAINNTASPKHDFASISLRANIPVQAKLAVNNPGDEFEQEADNIARQVMRMAGRETIQTKISSVPAIRRACATCGKEEKNHEPAEEKDKTEASEPLMLQPKLAINEPGDEYEQEADAVAEKIMNIKKNKYTDQSIFKPPSSVLVRQNTGCEPKEEKLHRKEPGYSTPVISSAVSKTLHAAGQPLDKNTRSFMEQSFGYDFGHVQIHNDALAHHSSKAINALAYTHGSHVVFGAGQYQPSTDRGMGLLAHELTHVVQQSGTGRNYAGLNDFHAKGATISLQLKGGTFGGFFANIGRGIVSIFGDEMGFSDEDIQAYLAVLDAGDIEDDYTSDDKARAVVRKWKAGKLQLSKERKVLLIREMFSGFTGDDDEQAILDILKGSSEELTYILTKIKPDEFRPEFQGSEYKELELILKPWEKRTGNVIPEPLDPKTAVKYDQPKILGDGTPANEGMKLSEFEQYIHEQADWFTEPSLKSNEVIRNQLWEIAFLIGEGDYITTALGNLKLTKIISATEGEMKALRAYAEGAKSDAQMVRITEPHDNFDTVVKWGLAMQELKTFVPGPVLKLVIDQNMLKEIIERGYVPEFKKYYKEFKPTIESKAEKSNLLLLLTEGIDPYITLKGWVHDLHIVDTETRLRLVDNVKQTNKINTTKPVLLILMSSVDYSGAFLNWAGLKSGILNTNNIALMIQGAESVSVLTAKVKDVARDYGLFTPPDGKPKLGQVVIAGHGAPTEIEQASSGKPDAKQDQEYVKYGQENIKIGKSGDDSAKLVDTILDVLDPKDANIVFAGCEVGSHQIPLETELQTDPATAAKNIKAALKASPNLRDLVESRVQALKIKTKVNVEAANATTVAQAFKFDANGKAILSLPNDPAIGKTKDEYVQKGAEPSGALKAALETWADKNYGPTWTTTAMRKYVTDNSAVTEWWKSMTRTVYELALPLAGDVQPTALNYLSRWAEIWFLSGFPDNSDASNLAVTVATSESLKNLPVNPKNFPVYNKLYPVMLASDRKDWPHLKVVVYQAWMQVDATKASDFLSAIDTTSLKGIELYHFLNATLIDKFLPVLLKTADPLNPTAAQLKLAFNIAKNMGAGMPKAVKTLLKDAAGNATTSSFPAALHVRDYLEGASEISILKYIGLAPGVKSEPTATGEVPSGPSKTKANADLNNDKNNESFISVQSRKLLLKTDAPVWEKPDPASRILDTLKKGTTVRVAGSSSGWAVIDFNGTVAYIDMTLIS